MSILSDIVRRLRGVVAAATVTRVDDSRSRQVVQVTLYDGDGPDDVERPQQYGFNARPLPGAEAVVVHLAADRSLPLVILVDDRRHRLRDLQPGEVAMADDLGQYVALLRDKISIGKDGSTPKWAARQDDAVRVDATTDAAFIDFCANLHAALDAWSPIPNDGGAALKTALSVWLAAGAPSSATGKVTGGSSKVEIG